MQIRWWRSIRWRLVFGSVLLALLATSLLALAALVAIVQFYGADQKTALENFANSTAQSIGENVVPHTGLAKAVYTVLPKPPQTNAQTAQYLVVIIDRRGDILYPHFYKPNASGAQYGYVLTSLKELDPLVNQQQLSKIPAAVRKVFRQKASTIDEIDKNAPVALPRPFTVQPIFMAGQSSGPVIGALFVIPRSAADNTIPPFISAVGKTVIVASLLAALIAVLAAMAFSRTITRPLAKLTTAAEKLASGDYKARVAGSAPGELGELAHSFNEMAAQLNRDVEELQQQELWRRELIMSITHDLATPLTAIAGLGESLVDGVNQSHEDYEATGRIIVRETLRLRRLVKDLHMMAKVEAGALYPQRQPIRLAPLVDEVLAVLAFEFERAHVEPLNAIPYNLPVLQADADMLTRVLSNLCDNALRHTPPDGTVTIESMLQERMLAISVVDTGEGIPPEALPRIFERFYRADSARQSITGGSGLGLAIVRAIVEAHGGKVWAENVPTGGARIAFTLPLQPAGQPSLPDADTLPLFKKRITRQSS